MGFKPELTSVKKVEAVCPMDSVQIGSVSQGESTSTHPCQAPERMTAMLIADFLPNDVISILGSIVNHASASFP